ESLDDIVGAVPGQSLRGAAGDRRYVHVDVAVVVGAESNGCAVRRELRLRFLALGSRQSIGAAAVAVRDPHVAVVHERNVTLADGWVRKQQRVLRIDGERSAAPQDEQRRGQQQARVETQHRDLPIEKSARLWPEYASPSPPVLYVFSRALEQKRQSGDGAATSSDDGGIHRCGPPHDSIVAVGGGCSACLGCA